jgi:hypothetical protein
MGDGAGWVEGWRGMEWDGVGWGVERDGGWSGMGGGVEGDGVGWGGGGRGMEWDGWRGGGGWSGMGGGWRGMEWDGGGMEAL